MRNPVGFKYLAHFSSLLSGCLVAGHKKLSGVLGY